jgi:hypothetical protein
MKYMLQHGLAKPFYYVEKRELKANNAYLPV